MLQNIFAHFTNWKMKITFCYIPGVHPVREVLVRQTHAVGLWGYSTGDARKVGRSTPDCESLHSAASGSNAVVLQIALVIPLFCRPHILMFMKSARSSPALALFLTPVLPLRHISPDYSYFAAGQDRRFMSVSMIWLIGLLRQPYNGKPSGSSTCFRTTDQ